MIGILESTAAKKLISDGGHITNTTRNRTQVNYSITIKLVYVYAMPRRKTDILGIVLELNKQVLCMHLSQTADRGFHRLSSLSPNLPQLAEGPYSSRQAPSRLDFLLCSKNTDPETMRKLSKTDAQQPSVIVNNFHKTCLSVQ